jgi:phage baseplate assembly protein gpV
MRSETPAWTAGIHLAQVVDDIDPMGLGRIQVRLTGLGLTLWAPVLIPGGGAGYGVALTPRRDEIVAVAFPGGDPAHPLVLGALWSGVRARPEAAGSPDESYAIVSPGGALILMEDREAPLKPTIDIKTDNGTRIRVEGGDGGKILIEHPSGTITLDAKGIAVASETAVSVSASTVQVSAGMVTIDAGMTSATGVVKCDTLIANAVVAASYAPGAGNIW